MSKVWRRPASIRYVAARRLASRTINSEASTLPHFIERYAIKPLPGLPAISILIHGTHWPDRCSLALARNENDDFAQREANFWHHLVDPP